MLTSYLMDLFQTKKTTTTQNLLASDTKCGKCLRITEKAEIRDENKKKNYVRTASYFISVVN